LLGGPEREGAVTPEQAIDRLEELHASASAAMRAALERFVSGGPPPDEANARASATRSCA
jgi:hypothetical protein